MSKLYIKDIADSEMLKQIFRHNEKLQQVINNIAYDNEMDYCQEIISCFDRKSIDYCLGYDRGCYVFCVDSLGFIDGLEIAQSKYAILPYAKNKDIEEVREWLSLAEALEYNGFDASEVEKAIEEACEDLANALHEEFTNCFRATFDENSTINLWLDYKFMDYFDCYIIIDETDTPKTDYILYEDIIKSYE